MLAIVCPGQGSQTPGFLAPWLELPGLAERLTHLGQTAGLDLVAHGTTSDMATIKDTAVAQPLLVAAGLLATAALPDAPADAPSAGLDQVGVWGGHSVGEITALGAAGVLDQTAAMSFVALRGRGMAQAAAATPTGMSAVLGGDPDEVLAALARHGLTPANVNGAGQVVAAGTLDQLAALREEPPTRAKVLPLPVAGAFHTEHMAPAMPALREHAAAMDARDAAAPVLSNQDGQALTDGRVLVDRLVTQVASPVRWDLCMQTMLDLGVTGLIELPPAGTLVGLAKRAMKGVELLAVKTPDDLEAARRMLQEHGTAPTDGGTR